MAGREVLDAVVRVMGGTRRGGQEKMVDAVAGTLDGGRHLLVQAETRIGKPIGYLTPAMEWVVKTDSRVTVSIAAPAPRRQIIAFNALKVAEAVREMHRRAPEVALVKGWSNYVCPRKAADGYPEEGVLLFCASNEYGMSTTGEEVVRLREWVMATDTGDRDDLVPGVPERAQRQASIAKPECIGTKYPMRGSCFPVLTREVTEEADAVVTNHSMLGIQSTGIPVPSGSTAFIAGEAHELTDRIMDQLTTSISKGDVSSLVRLSRREPILATKLENAGDKMIEALDELDEGRLKALPLSLADGLSRMLGELQQAHEDVNDLGDKDEAAATAKTLVHGRAKALADAVEQLLSDGVGEDAPVLWVARDGEGGSPLHVAPLDISSALTDTLSEGKAAILMFVTLETGDSLRHIAGVVGLTYPSQDPWKGIDADLPFDHLRQGIFYAAASLPPPGREGIDEAQLREIAELVEAAGGGVLGLFTSCRAAETATEYARERLDTPVLCQGDDQFSTFVRRFAEGDAASLFGTLLLWQGVDILGRACRLVLIDRIPFPRPNGPLTQACTEAVIDTRGNGFMSVAATHAALLLVQGVGRPLYRTDDREVVAILDPRIITARCGSFLVASLPSMWRTKDPHVTRSALRRLAAAPDPARDCAGGSDSAARTGAETQGALASA